MASLRAFEPAAASHTGSAPIFNGGAGGGVPSSLATPLILAAVAASTFLPPPLWAAGGAPEFELQEVTTVKALTDNAKSVARMQLIIISYAATACAGSRRGDSLRLRSSCGGIV